MSRTPDGERNGHHRVQSGHPTRYRKRIKVVKEVMARFYRGQRQFEPSAVVRCDESGRGFPAVP